MKMKRMTAAFLAALMSVSLCACGDDDPAAEISSVIDKTAEEITSEAEVTDPAETESSEGENEETENSVPAPTGEAAEVQKVVDTYFKALAEKDYDTLLDVTDIELIYYLSEGETGTREDYLTCLKEQVVSEEGDYSGYDISAPKLDEDYVQIYADFFEMMDEMAEGEAAFAENFKIDRVYSVRMKADTNTEIEDSEDDGISVSGTISGSFDVDMPIIHVNGEWKCDPVVSTVMAFYTAFSDMADSFSEAE